MSPDTNRLWSSLFSSCSTAPSLFYSLQSLMMIFSGMCSVEVNSLHAFDFGLASDWLSLYTLGLSHGIVNTLLHHLFLSRALSLSVSLVHSLACIRRRSSHCWRYNTPRALSHDTHMEAWHTMVCLAGIYDTQGWEVMLMNTSCCLLCSEACP